MNKDKIGWGVYLPTDKGLKQEYWFNNQADAIRLQGEYMDELEVEVTVLQTWENEDDFSRR